MSTNQSVAESQALDNLMRDIEQYEPTPQEKRWAEIEHHARTTLARIEAGGVTGITFETRCAMDDLAKALSVTFRPEQGNPLVR
ncbi:MAG: hypothetical protein ACX94C_11630 [Phycisphaerales bacterium]